MTSIRHVIYELINFKKCINILILTQVQQLMLCTLHYNQSQVRVDDWLYLLLLCLPAVTIVFYNFPLRHNTKLYMLYLVEENIWLPM